MIKWFLRRRVAAFERQWNYDAGYIHELIDADPRAAIAFARAVAVGRYRRNVPLAPHYAAGIAAVMAEDCGPCTQLAIDMAVRDGLDAAVVNAIVTRDFSAMPDDVAVAVRFADATLRRAPEADGLREDVVRRWGERGLVSLAFAILAGRMYPVVKYALGHGKSCIRLRIGDELWLAPARLGQAA